MALTSDYRVLWGLVANSTGVTQFYGCKIASTAGEAVIGVQNSTTGPAGFFGLCQNNPSSGEAVEFAYEGIAKGVAATSTIAAGDRVSINSTGTLADAGVTDNIFYVGRALEAASASGDVITVSLVGNGGARY